MKNDYWFLFLQTSNLLKVSRRFCFWAKTASSFQTQKQWASIYRYLRKPFRPLQSDKGIPQCNWQDSIYQLRKNTNGTRNRTERVKTNKASNLYQQFQCIRREILWEDISEHLKNSANEATPRCHTSLSPQRGIQQTGTIAQKLILPWDYTVTSNLLGFVLSITQHSLHAFKCCFLNH